MDRCTRSTLLGGGGLYRDGAEVDSIHSLDGGWAGKLYKIQAQPVRNHRLKNEATHKT